MATSKELTGGTGDVNPQWLSALTEQSAADVTTQSEVNLPIPRFAAKAGRAIVLEVLAVDFIFADFGAAPAANSFVLCTLGTNQNDTAIASSAVFAVVLLDSIFTSAVGVSVQNLVYRQNLSDGAGHGILIATDSIFMTVISAATLQANAFVAKILYRFKEVSLSEYIGIVQGQN